MGFDRRTFLQASGLAGLGMLSAGTAEAADLPFPEPTGRFDLPQKGFAPANTVLRKGKAGALGLDTGQIDSALVQIAGLAQPPNGAFPMFPGAVTLLAHHAVVFADTATGWALRYADGEGTELPESQRTPMRTDTIFDMASLSKLYTTLVALQLLEEGKFDLNTPVAHYLPGYEVNGKASITPEMLLTHTAGLPPDPKPSLWEGYPDIPSRKQAIMDSPLDTAPGTAYSYSDLSLLSIQLLIEKLTGSTLDVELHKRVIAPLGLRDTCYNPSPALKQRIAPTEFQTGPGTTNRGLVWGKVHDENAWTLGGVAGHAGVFTTAHDLSIIAQMIMNGGVYAGKRILKERTTQQIFTDYNARFAGDSHGLGFELDQLFYMGGLTSLDTAGHTGFTGTSVVIDRASRSIAILLTNRVHPNRVHPDGVTNNTPSRRMLGTQFSRALRVPAVAGKDYWFTETGDSATATLSTRQFDTGLRAATVTFSAFVQAEETDLLTLEFSTDGTNWNPVSLRANGNGAPQGIVPNLSGHAKRAWWKVRADVPDAANAPKLQLRWKYTTDKSYTARGICLDDIKVINGRQTLLDTEREPAALTGTGWSLVKP